MSKKKGLGKGLGALISSVHECCDEDNVIEKNESLKMISVNTIFPNPRQARINFNSEKLEELKNSIAEHGIVQPIVVRPLPNGNYELIAGERRWRACKKLGLENIPAIVKIYSDVEASAISLIENIQRDDLNSLEEAMAYKKLMDTFGLTQEELSNQVGKSRSFIANLVRLLSLPDEIKKMLINNMISTGHAKALLALNEEKLQFQIAEKIISDSLSVRETEKLISDLKNTNNKKIVCEVKENSFVVDLESRLNNIFNTKVNITVNSKGKGKIQIEYKNEDDLNRIIKLIEQKI